MVERSSAVDGRVESPPSAIAAGEVGGVCHSEVSEGLSREARGVALIANNDHAEIGRSDVEAVWTGWIEAPFKMDALDHYGAGHRPFGSTVLYRADIDKDRPSIDFSFELVGMDSFDTCPGLHQHLLD